MKKIKESKRAVFVENNIDQKGKLAFNLLLKDCIQVDELKKRTTVFIESLPWKN